MSKEKLKEIRDIYEVDAHEYIRELGFLTNDIDELMRLAYNQALNDAADIAEVKYITILKGKNEYEIKAVVNKESIRKLKTWKEDLI